MQARLDKVDLPIPTIAMGSVSESVGLLASSEPVEVSPLGKSLSKMELAVLSSSTSILCGAIL